MSVLTPGEGLPSDLVDALLKLLMRRRDDPLPSEWPTIIPPGWRRYFPSTDDIARRLGRAGQAAARAAMAEARMKALDLLVGEPCLTAADLFKRTGHSDAAVILREFVRADGPQSRTFLYDSNFSLGFAGAGTTGTSVAKALHIWKTRSGGFKAKDGTITGLGNSFVPLSIDMSLLPPMTGRIVVETSPEANIIGSFAYEGRLVTDSVAEWRAVNYMSLQSYFAEHWLSKINVSLIDNNDWPERYGTTQQIIFWRTTLTGEVVG